MASYYPYTWPKLTWIYSLLLPPCIAMPVVQIWPPIAPINGHAHGSNLASCCPYVWPYSWPRFGFLLPLYMAMPVAQIDVNICPPFASMHGYVRDPN